MGARAFVATRVRIERAALAGVLVAACGSAPPADDEPTDAAVALDAPPDVPAVWTSTPACSAAPDAIYATPASSVLAAMARGAIASCALGDELDAATAEAEMADEGADVDATTGVRVVKLAYRTVRSDGTAAVSTATVYLPLVPRAMPAPVVLVGRSTSGSADDCAPSKEPRPERNLALPFAARGFVTITPDFAGLGNDGVHAYLDNHEAAAQLFDGARALAALVPGAIGAPVAAVGYSQGGGVVLSAQALEHAETGARTLRGVVAIAPEWPISTRSFGYEDVLRDPDGLTAFAGLAPPVVTVLRHYGFLANRVGAAAAGDSFPADERASITSSIDSLCTVALGGALNAQQRRLRELVDDNFRRQVLACIDGTAGCTGLGAQFHAWLVGDFVTADAAGARVLVVQGLGDQVMPADEEAACVVDKLRAEGVEPAICSDGAATHDTVLERRIEDVVAWVEAVASNAVPPVCGSTTLPACTR